MFCAPFIAQYTRKIGRMCSSCAKINSHFFTKALRVDGGFIYHGKFSTIRVQHQIEGNSCQTTFKGFVDRWKFASLNPSVGWNTAIREGVAGPSMVANPRIRHPNAVPMQALYTTCQWRHGSSSAPGWMWPTPGGKSWSTQGWL